MLAQSPKLYFTLTSHNEPNESYTASASYNPVKDTLKRIVDIVFAKNAKYNMQIMPNFAQGALTHQMAASSATDILEYANKIGGTAGAVVEIDPRYKTTTFYNIADVCYSINLTGATASKNVGGFVYYNSTVTPVSSAFSASADWLTYTASISGINTPSYSWKADVIWGAGSLPPHTNDANNYGSWKPRGKSDSIDFYCHDPNQTVWLQGNGCGWVLTPTTNVNQMISEIRSEATKIVNGTYPSNKFYNGHVMINFRDFGTSTVTPGFQMPVVLSRVIDSINVMVAQGKIEWKTITQKQAAFTAWSTLNNIPYSQWRCGQTTTLAAVCNMTGLEKRLTNNFVISPNPTSKSFKVKGLQNQQQYTVEILDATGRLFMKEEIVFLNEKEISLQCLNPGLYYIKIGTTIHKIIKE
jgi:hypothetical protein